MNSGYGIEPQSYFPVPHPWVQILLTVSGGSSQARASILATGNSCNENSFQTTAVLITLIGGRVCQSITYTIVQRKVQRLDRKDKPAYHKSMKNGDNVSSRITTPILLFFGEFCCLIIIHSQNISTYLSRKGSSNPTGLLSNITITKSFCWMPVEIEKLREWICCGRPRSTSHHGSASLLVCEFIQKPH